MDKRRPAWRNWLYAGVAYIILTTPRSFFAVGTLMTVFWLCCIGYVCAVGHAEAVPAVLLRVAVSAAFAVIGAVFHRVVGNDDQAWEHYMFWKKRSGR